MKSVYCPYNFCAKIDKINCLHLISSTNAPKYEHKILISSGYSNAESMYDSKCSVIDCKDLLCSAQFSLFTKTIFYAIRKHPRTGNLKHCIVYLPSRFHSPVLHWAKSIRPKNKQSGNYKQTASYELEYLLRRLGMATWNRFEWTQFQGWQPRGTILYCLQSLPGKVGLNLNQELKMLEIYWCTVKQKGLRHMENNLSIDLVILPLFYTLIQVLYIVLSQSYRMTN